MSTDPTSSIIVSDDDLSSIITWLVLAMFTVGACVGWVGHVCWLLVLAW